MHLHRFINSTELHQQDNRQRELQISDIRSHARQQAYLKWRNGPAPEWWARTQQQPPKRNVLSVSQNQRACLRKATRPILTHPTPSGSSDSADSTVQTDEDDVLSDTEAKGSLKDVWMPVPLPVGSKTDPFGCIPGSNELSARIGLDFLTVSQWCWPAYAAISRAFDMPVLYHCAWMLEQISKHQSLFHIIVAHTLLIRPGESRERDLHMHKAKSISMLRKRLLLPRAAFDDGVILTAIFLCHHEAAAGDGAAATMHCQRVYQLIAARGGVTSWGTGTGIRALVDFYRDLTATTVQHGPTASSFHFPQLPMSVNQLQTFRKLPVGFQDLALIGELTTETIDIILRILDTWCGSRRPEDGSSQGSYGVAGPYYRDETNYEILNQACPGLTIADAPGGPALERLLCTMLMRVCIDEKHRFKTPGSLFQSLTAKLQRLLPLASIPSEGPERSCLLWIWITMADSWPTQPNEAAGWLQRTRDLFSEIRQWKLEDVVRFGQRYLWTTGLSRAIASHWPMVA